MIHATRLSAMGFCVAALLALTGCGPGKGSVVTGKIVLPKDIKLEKDDQVSINFIPEGDAKYAAAGSANGSDLSFTIATGTVGVQPGKYKITVSITPYPNPNLKESEKRNRTLNDGFNKQFDKTATKLSYEVVSGDNNITIDLQNNTVKKN